MKNITRKKVEKDVVTSIRCDVCLKEYKTNDDGSGDFLDAMEFVHIDRSCGYGNMAFGDMTHIQLDMCQYCTRDLLGRYIRVNM